MAPAPSRAASSGGHCNVGKLEAKELELVELAHSRYVCADEVDGRLVLTNLATHQQTVMAEGWANEFDEDDDMGVTYTVDASGMPVLDDINDRITLCSKQPMASDSSRQATRSSPSTGSSCTSRGPQFLL